MKKNKEIEDDLLQRAFDPDEELPLPEDYMLDEINYKSVQFLKKVEKEREKIERKKEIDIEYSLNVDNQSKFTENYLKLNISMMWINAIKKEFNQLKSLLKKKAESLNSHKSMNAGDIINSYKLQKENVKYIEIPNDSIINTLLPQMTNKICFKLISHFEKLFLLHETSNFYAISMWIYFLLVLIKTPIVDEDNSVLYSLNKNIVRYLKDSNEELVHLKIIHVLISEIFYQKIVN